MRIFAIKYPKRTADGFINDKLFGYVGVVSPYGEYMIRESATRGQSIFHFEDELPRVLSILQTNGFENPIVEEIISKPNLYAEVTRKNKKSLRNPKL
jgi:hypothetical protein